MVRRERNRGRRVLVFASHTGVRDITRRLRTMLERGGLRLSTLRADTVSAKRRENWLATRVREGLDVLVTNPQLAQPGLDLVKFRSVVWVEVNYTVYALRQARRRSWQVGQCKPVEVTFLVYDGTLQADALGLVAAKTRASRMIDGAMPEDGLTALDRDGADVYLTLARRPA